MLKAVTWLDQSNIQYFVHLAVVSCDMEHALRGVLYARDVDRNQILRHLLPLHCASSARTNVEHFCPKPVAVMFSDEHENKWTRWSVSESRTGFMLLFL